MPDPESQGRLSQQSQHSQLSRRNSEARPESFRGTGCRGKFCRCLWHFLQQKESRSTLYLRFYTRGPQTLCTLVVAVTLFILGGGVYSQSSGPTEVIITYRAGDTTKSFSLDEDLTGTVQIHYEIPDVMFNNKDYVSSKDKDSVYTFFSSVSCTNADTLEWAQLRRGSDTSFINRLTAAGSSLAPCGLVNLALFTDSYSLERQTSLAWEAVSIDSSSVAWTRDISSFDKVYEDQGTIYLANERPSWLPAEWLEHWKVWQRTPPGTTVRNLWGVVQGGLQQGSYRINFLENSPIWEEWGVPERRLILTGNPGWLGNVGAMQTLAGAMFIFGGLELGLFGTLVVLYFILKIGPTTAPERPVLQPVERPTPEEFQVPEAAVVGPSRGPPREVVHSLRV